MPSLPSYVRILADGFAEQRENALLRSEFESGPPRQAKVKSRVMVRRPAKLYIESKADYLAFVEWFKADLNEGANWFDWADPVRGTTVQARIVAGDLTASPAPGLKHWVIPVTLETWG